MEVEVAKELEREVYDWERDWRRERVVVMEEMCERRE